MHDNKTIDGIQVSVQMSLLFYVNKDNFSLTSLSF